MVHILGALQVRRWLSDGVHLWGQRGCVLTVPQPRQFPSPLPAAGVQAAQPCPEAGETAEAPRLETRADKLERYRRKKACRNFHQTIRYQTRKVGASKRGLHCMRSQCTRCGH
jgi:hypothetical protein